MTADVGRTAVYAAEESAFGGTDLDDERPLPELVAAGTALTGLAWWRAAGGPLVRVAAAPAASTSSCARAAPEAEAVDVWIAAGQRTMATLAHELAHALAGPVHGHDATFRAAHVDVCALLADRGAAGSLAGAYRRLGLHVARRTWPPPVRAVGDGFVIVP